MKTDTIAAIATGMSNSGIGIVRISGEQAFSVIDSIFRNRAHLLWEQGVVGSNPATPTEINKLLIFQ